jgi:hypothetical protein
MELKSRAETYACKLFTFICNIKRTVKPVSVLTATCILGLPAYGGNLHGGLDGRLIVGYQGWFGCPNDFEDNKSWQHWFVGEPDPKHLTVDLLPSVRALDQNVSCATGLHKPDGAEVRLFSSQDPRTVTTHFRWMQERDIDGAALQRFVVELRDAHATRRRDNVLKNVIAAAEATGRVFYLTYDVSGADPKSVINDIRRDWSHVVSDLKATDSPNYLRDHGKPVLELWGFGFVGRPGEPEEVASLVSDLHSGSKGLRAAHLIGGVPSSWRTLSGDSRSEALWARIYRSYDTISPWSVGRFPDDSGATNFQRQIISPDIAEAKRANINYMPVIFPGFSWSNLMRVRNQPDKAITNQIARHCGDFLWHQFTGLQQLNVRTVYLAMFDELDEGTAIMPSETRSDKLPVAASMVYLNVDGCALPDDWYLRVSGQIAHYLHTGSPAPQMLKSVLNP